jgi:hypothetical protein
MNWEWSCDVISDMSIDTTDLKSTRIVEMKSEW